ncbi:KpsF/GutQ family sugar-phosphate isomerase [Saccharibacter sp. 17.LH.SD]|uniref:KpsF/GutQ family sugar-phosphate isomerase n=1 Tax=Saccharibacter sp. 17.LH.SD TaxID=2689393 RepID=UPI0013712B3A|nr:KpsF/GutQ family sugar-phosphate isomerase [Saccharibacter sp. 17.LH.SD]MXV44119.1 KpsF/GutQ family sugar-phosphate isomerase [Saccharibacter sp. 17.LH.SD]
MSSSPLTVFHQSIATQRDGLAELERALSGPLGEHMEQAVSCILATTGRVVITGIGKSGHIGRKIQATLASTGTHALFLHPAEAAHGDLGMLKTDDIVIALSTSGESAELAPVLSYTTRLDLPLIAITSAPHSTLAQASRICLTLPIVREACPMGLAPTTSSLLQLALGDALAAALLDQRRFTATDFSQLHPAGQLGAQLRPVKELMHVGDTIPLGTPDMPLRNVIVEMTRKAFGCMGVIDPQGKLCGLITDGDLRRALEHDLDHTIAANIMNLTPLTARPNMLAKDVLHAMNDRPTPVSSVFVIDQDRRPLGILHLHDFIRAGVA